MGQIITVAQIADIHLRNIPTRNVEYASVFANLYKSLRKDKPSRIMINGDLVHDYLHLEGEQLILASDLLDQLALIAPVRIVRGNHDFKRINPQRVDSVKAIVDTLHNKNIIYYDTTGFIDDENITWCVWHHGSSSNSPWTTKTGIELVANKDPNRVYIDLFHDPINGCQTVTGFEMTKKTLRNLGDFNGDLLFLGDIHKKQYFYKNNALFGSYPSSLIAQDFGEGDDNFHGYLLWNVEKSTVIEKPIANDYSFKNIIISSYVDFDDIDIEIDEPTTFMKVRFIWKTLPYVRTSINENKLVAYIKGKYPNITSVSNKSDFIIDNKIVVSEDVTLVSINETTVQQAIFTEHLDAMGIEAATIKDVIDLDDIISGEIDHTDDVGGNFNIIKFGGRNFASYETIDIDWRELNGLFQIVGKNTAGKTTLIKLISYILYNKSLETEGRVKFGDSRYVNNRNGATFCDAYMVFDYNSEYYGIKKRTTITRSKDGAINGAPTTLNYYLMASPDDEMNDQNSLDNMSGDQRIKTQKIIESLIGSYDNFMRIVVTTADTLNKILSNDMSTFIDSLLFDSGLDIFDKKLDACKKNQKRLAEKGRINCNVENSDNEILRLKNSISELELQLTELESVTVVEIENSMSNGRKYVDTLHKDMHKIDDEIYNMDIEQANRSAEKYKITISDYYKRIEIIEKSMSELKNTYDEARYNELVAQKDTHRNSEYALKLKIKDFESTISRKDHEIEIINGKIVNLKRDGLKIKNELIGFKQGTTEHTCPTCHQSVAQDNEHIKQKISDLKTEMFSIADTIKNYESVDIIALKDSIVGLNAEINIVKEQIEVISLTMVGVLAEIGVLNNDKNDYMLRLKLADELERIPLYIRTNELELDIIGQKIIRYGENIIQIDENKKLSERIKQADAKIQKYADDLKVVQSNIYNKRLAINDSNSKIVQTESLVKLFKAQEHVDNVYALYIKCVHRDGIPRQMLVNYIIPKINNTLASILSVSAFKVWLDLDDLRPKLAYNSRPLAVIDCISASGKERTFSAIVLKFALNQINAKVKPTIFMLDEVMGKLSADSIEEFNEILQLIKDNMQKVLVIEHNHEINPDYVINVQLDENEISTLTINTL